MNDKQIIGELKKVFEAGVTNVDDAYKSMDIMVNDDQYGEPVFVLKQIERYFSEADVYWPTGFTFIASTLVNCQNEGANILGRKLLNEFYDQCRESHEALDALFFEVPLDSNVKDNTDMQSFLKRVLDSVELSADEYQAYEELLQ